MIDNFHRFLNINDDFLPDVLNIGTPGLNITRRKPIYPSYELPLLSSILPTRGSVVPLFSRATTATVVDFEGVVHTCKIDEARFQGARRVENLLTPSEDASSATDINTGVTVTPQGDGVDKVFLNNLASYAVRWTFFDGESTFNLTGATSIDVKGEGSDIGKDIWLKVQRKLGTLSNTAIRVRLTGEWQRIEVANTNEYADNTGFYAILAAYPGAEPENVLIRRWQFELAKGTQTGASEYVSNGVLSSPYHGANVDGVKYFNTDRNGDVLSTTNGFLNEPQSTNLGIHSESFDNTIWSKIGCTVDNGILSPDDTFTANTLVEDTANSEHFINQSISIVDSTFIHSFYVKKKDSSRNLVRLRPVHVGETSSTSSITYDLDAAEVTEISGLADKADIEELHNGWYRCWARITLTTACTDHKIRIQLLNSSGDSLYTGDGVSGIYIWGAQVEESTFPTSYIKTEASAVTKTADSLTVDNSSRSVLPNSFCFAGTWTPLGAGTDYAYPNVRFFGSQDSRFNDYEVRSSTVFESVYKYISAAGGGFIRVSYNDINQLIENKYAFQLFQDGSDANVEVYKDGVQKLSETEAQTLDHSNESLEIGSWAGAVFASTIKNIKIYDKELSNAKLTRLTE